MSILINPCFPFKLDAGRQIRVKVKRLKGGQIYTIDMPSSSTVLELKEKLFPLSSVSPANQHLVLKGKALHDTKPLYEYDVGDANVIHLVVKSSAQSVDVTSSPPSSEREGGSKKSSLDKMKSDAFWNSLHAFLGEQFSNSDDVERVYNVFKKGSKELVNDE